MNPNPAESTVSIQTPTPIDTPPTRNASASVAGGPPPSPLPAEAWAKVGTSKLPFIIAGIIIVSLIGTGAFFLGKSQNNPKIATSASPTPTFMPLSASSSPLPTTAATANWKTYTSQAFILTMRLPQNWFTPEEGSSQFPYLRVQNYNPTGTPGRGYDPIQDKGKYLLSISRLPAGNKGNFTIEDIINSLPKEGDKEYYLGDEAGAIKILKQDTFEINGFPALRREQSYTKFPNQTTTNIYLLDKKGNGIIVNYGLDVQDGKPILDQILSTFKFLDQNQSNQEKITSSEITADKCQIKIKTTNREIFLNTSYTAIGPQSKCYQFVKNIWSPSGTFVAFQDISGGIDTQIRMFALQQKDIQSHNLEVLGTSTIFDMIFLPNDKLGVLSGFPDDMSSYAITIYDLPNLYKTYPNNLEKGVDLFTNLDQNKKVINLPNIGKGYNAMSVSNGRLRIHGTQGIDTPSLQEYNINTL